MLSLDTTHIIHDTVPQIQIGFSYTTHPLYHYVQHPIHPCIDKSGARVLLCSMGPLDKQAHNMHGVPNSISHAACQRGELKSDGVIEWIYV